MILMLFFLGIVSLLMVTRVISEATIMEKPKKKVKQGVTELKRNYKLNFRRDEKILVGRNIFNSYPVVINVLSKAETE